MKKFVLKKFVMLTMFVCCFYSVFAQNVINREVDEPVITISAVNPTVLTAVSLGTGSGFCQYGFVYQAIRLFGASPSSFNTPVSVVSSFTFSTNSVYSRKYELITITSRWQMSSPNQPCPNPVILITTTSAAMFLSTGASPTLSSDRSAVVSSVTTVNVSMPIINIVAQEVPFESINTLLNLSNLHSNSSIQFFGNSVSVGGAGNNQYFFNAANAINSNTLVNRRLINSAGTVQGVFNILRRDFPSNITVSSVVCGNQTLDLVKLKGLTSNFGNFEFSGDGVFGGSISGEVMSGNSSIVTVTRKYANSTVTSSFTVVKNPIETGLFETIPIVCGNDNAYVVMNNIQPQFRGGVFTIVGHVNSHNILVNGVFNAPVSGQGDFNLRYMFTNSVTGCVTSNNTTLTVHPIISVSAGPNALVCLNKSDVRLVGGAPSGGVWSGLEVSSNVINVINVPVGNHAFTYTVSNNEGKCLYSAIKTVSVRGANFVKINGGTGMFISPVTLCGFDVYDLDANTNTNVIIPVGVYKNLLNTNNAITNSMISASVLGSGIGFYSYTYIDQNDGCGIRDSNRIVSRAAINVTNDSDYSVCPNVDVVFDRHLPLLGTFTGIGSRGVSAIFNTSVLGNSVITYSFRNVDGCVYSRDFSVFVNAIPLIQSGSVLSICGNSPIISLVDASVQPKNGVFNGLGVVNNTLDMRIFPLSKTPYVSDLVYSVVDNVSGCVANATRKVFYLPVPLTVGAVTSSRVCNSGSFTLSVDTIRPGFVYNYFNRRNDLFPSATSSKFITPTLSVPTKYFYSFRNGFGCTSMRDSVITLLSLSDPLFTMKDTTLFIGSGVVDLKGFLNKNEVTITGVNGRSVASSQINTNSERVGSMDVTYQFRNEVGCISNAKQKIIFNAASTPNAINGLIKLGIKVWPNPSSSEFNLTVPYGKVYEYKLYDIIGSTVGRGKCHDEIISLIVSSPGLYFLELTNIESLEKVIVKLIKQ